MPPLLIEEVSAIKYNLTLITSPAIEPITLEEAKAYLRLSSDTFAGNITTHQSIKPGSQGVVAAFGLLGAAINVLGKSTLVNLNAGTCGAGGSVAAKIQESENGTTWTDYAGGAFTTVTEANDNAIQEKAYTGGKMYVRVVATVAVAACEFSADVIAEGATATDDAFITGLVTAAREYCEGFQNRAYITQTWEMALECFPSGIIEIPKGKLQSIDEITYKDSAGTITTLTADTDYIVSTAGILGVIAPPYGKTWPTATLYPLDPVTIEYTCGYGDAAANVPKMVKQVMYMLISHWYDNRMTVVIGSATSELDFAVKALLSMDRIAVM